MKVQLIYAWNQLNVELQHDISELSNEISLTDFIQSMKVKKQIWFKLVRQERMLNCVSNLQDQSQNQNVMKHADNFNFSDSNQQLFQNGQFQESTSFSFCNSAGGQLYQTSYAYESQYQQNYQYSVNNQYLSMYQDQVYSLNQVRQHSYNNHAYSSNQVVLHSFNNQAYRDNQDLLALHQFLLITEVNFNWVSSSENEYDEQMRQLVWSKYQTGNENRYQQINYQSHYQDNAKSHFAQNHSSQEVQPTQAAYVSEEKDENPHSHLKADQQESDIEGIEDDEAYSAESYTENYEQSNEIDEMKTNHIQVFNLSKTTYICYWCTSIFKFNNMLHKHLSICKRKQSIKITLNKSYVSLEESVNEQIIKSFTRITADTEYGFWFWHYAAAEAHIDKVNNQSYEICTDTDCIMFLIDRKFLLSNTLNILVICMSFLIRVHELRSKIHSCSDFILLDLYLDDKVDSQVKTAHIYHEVYVVDNLNVKLLLDLNILKSEEIIIDLKKKCLIIHSCQDLKISIRITLKMEMWVLHTVHFKNRVIILSNSVTAILTGIQGAKSSADQDYLFELNQRQLTQKLSTSKEFYIYVVNCNLFFM